MDGVERRKAGALQPALNLIVGEAEVDVRMLALQFDHVVRREIDHQNGAARAYDAGRLGKGCRRIVGVMQDVVDGHGVEAVGLERKGIHVALADLDVLEAGAGEIGAGKRQHFARLVDAHRLFDPGGQHLEQPAGAGTDVEQPLRPQRQVMRKGAFDLPVGDVQRAQFVPALGVVAEEACRRVLTTLLQGVEASPVGGDPGMLGVEPADEFTDQCRVLTRGNQTKAGELALAKPLQEASFDDQLQVP